MALTTRQRDRLPASAFAIPSRRAYPMPTKAQARKAGISEAQRLRTHRNAISRAAQRGTGGSKAKMSRIARARTGGKVGGRRR
jgi:hypothetical protein